MSELQCICPPNGPQVYNLNSPICPEDAVYCGRGSPYGNPFVIGKDGDRDQVCDRFDAEILPSLDVTPLKGKNLKCFCKPLRCHCDSILKKANEKTKKTWQEARKVPLVVLSASQAETYDLCNRKWWLSKIRKLQMPTTKSQVNGTVLHSVAERFLTADNLGRDEKGNPVNLFPDGWMVAESRFAKPDEPASEGTITLTQADVIQRLVKEAIDSGVLERPENRLVENGFRTRVIPNVDIVGWIDLIDMDPVAPGVQDHKTSSAMKWAKSAEALKKNIQMLIYAHEVLQALRDDGKPDPEKISLRHNVYCTDPEDLRVRKTEAWVTPAEVDKFWTEFQATAARMVKLRAEANTWKEAPGPTNRSACSAYGGCPFRGICGGMESEEKYEKRLDGTSNPTYTNANDSTSSTERKHMGLMDRIKRNAAESGATGGAPPAPQNTQAPVVQTAPAPADPNPVPPVPVPAAAGAPPWANGACAACKGMGFNSQGNPCRPCDFNATKTNGKHSGLYILQAMGDGTCYWQLKADDKVSGTSPMVVASAEPVKQEAKTQAPTVAAPVVAPTIPANFITTPTKSGETTASPAADAPAPVTDKRFRAKKGFTLCVNCVVSKGENKVTRLLETFKDLQAEFQKDTGVGYFEYDAFKRRDALAKHAEKIAESFGTDMVTADCANGSPDFKALVEAIRPYASMEIVGTHL